jgi:hypothetical protein
LAEVLFNEIHSGTLVVDALGVNIKGFFPILRTNDEKKRQERKKWRASLPRYRHNPLHLENLRSNRILASVQIDNN